MPRFSWSEGSTKAIGGEFTTSVDQTLIKDWFALGATLSGSLSYTVTQDQQSIWGADTNLLAGQAAKAVPMALVLRTIRQVTAVSSSSSNRPPEGSAGESAVVSEQADVFRYGFNDWWTTSTLEVPDHTVYVWKTFVQ